MRLLSVSLLAVLLPATACSAAGETGETAGFSVTELSFPAGENVVLLADFDGDGPLDLISASAERGEISIRLGDGVGGFAGSADYRVGDSPTRLDSADFDGDGHLDLVIANHEQSYLTVAFGGGGRVHRTERFPLPAELAPHAHMVRAADIDRNGSPDLVVDSRDRYGVFVLLNQAGEALRFRAVAIDVRGAPYLGFALGDLDGDSALDLATPNGNDVSVLLNRGGNAAPFVLAQQVAVRSPFSVALADIDGDGALDLLAASEDGAGGLSVFLNDGSGGLAATASARHELAAGAKSLASGDIDGDGSTDVVATAWSSDLAVLFGGRTDTLARPPLGSITAPWSIAVGDIDGDGRDEFVVVDGMTGQGALYAWGG